MKTKLLKKVRSLFYIEYSSITKQYYLYAIPYRIDYLEYPTKESVLNDYYYWINVYMRDEYGIGSNKRIKRIR